jgi:hypothetical protein
MAGQPMNQAPPMLAADSLQTNLATLDCAAYNVSLLTSPQQREGCRAFAYLNFRCKLQVILNTAV